MSLFNLFKSSDTILKEKIIFTQKARIASLEREINEMKDSVKGKDDEIKETRTNFERSKERLVDQIVELSDKFAELNHGVLGLANELKMQLKSGIKGAKLIESKKSKKKKR